VPTVRELYYCHCVWEVRRPIDDVHLTRAHSGLGYDGACISVPVARGRRDLLVMPLALRVDRDEKLDD